MTIQRIISGGQTGANQAGLFAARELCLKTGGWMPRGWRTDEGSNKQLAEDFNLSEHREWTYPPRTKLNVKESDGTLIFGNSSSPGCSLTYKYCMENHKKVFIYIWPAKIDNRDILNFQEWIIENQIKTLNVAGNRERTNPGIFLACKSFLVQTLGGL